MSWSADDIPDLTGSVAVLTGANGGLGLETTRELARRGALVVMAARDPEKSQRAREDVLSEIPAAALELRPLDLASLASVRATAAAILSVRPRIDILVNNAGLMGISEQRTADGFEMQLGVNHLGHFALTALLCPALLRSPSARVVSVTSVGRSLGRPVDPANPHLRGRYGPWRAYGQSKLANVHFALELDRRFRTAAVSARSLIVDPGFVHTDLQARSVRETQGGASQRFFHEAVMRFGMSPSEGALALLRAATDPTADGGEFYAPRFVSHGPPVRHRLGARARNRSAMEALWRVSERETGIAFDMSAVRDAIG